MINSIWKRLHGAVSRPYGGRTQQRPSHSRQCPAHYGAEHYAIKSRGSASGGPQSPPGLRQIPQASEAGSAVGPGTALLRVESRASRAHIR